MRANVMKSTALLLLLFVAFTLKAQTKADLFKSTDFRYYFFGIDYSHAKFIGDFSQFDDAGSKSMVSIKNVYFSGWNGVVNREREKYDLAGAMRKDEIIYDIREVESINADTKVEEMEDVVANELTRDDLQGYLNSYSFTYKEGVAFMFICEYLDKIKEEGCFHFIAFNLTTKQLILNERMIGAAGGIGLRNYWVRPVDEIIQLLDKKYRKWEKEYK